MRRELNKGLKRAAEPVRTDAESMARAGIRKMTPAWARMRIGVTRRAVYVAPASRATTGKRKRRNLADLLLARSMLPSLDRNVAEVERSVDDVIGDMSRAWEDA